MNGRENRNYPPHDLNENKGTEWKWNQLLSQKHNQQAELIIISLY